MKEPTLLQYYPVLKQKDKALICRALNETRKEGQGEIHLGILPFISMSRVAKALRDMPCVNSRVWADLAAKCEIRRWLGQPKTRKGWFIFNPAKVAKRLGRRPDLGVTLPIIPNERMIGGGLKWNIGAREWQREKIIAKPRITLTQHTKTPDMWELAAPARYWDVVVEWLCAHCM